MDEAGKDIEQSTSNNPNANNMSAKLEENGTNGEHLDHCHTAGDHHDHLHHHHEQEHQHQHHHGHGEDCGHQHQHPHQHHGHGDEGGHQHQHPHHTLHLEHHHQSAEDIAAAEAHQQAANLQQQQHGAYASLTSEQLQAISSASSPAVAQAQALQHQLQQHLQHQLHQNPFPFAYQTMTAPVGVPSAHMGANGAVGGEDPQQIKPRPKRKQVKSACLNCRKRKTGCDAYRPCTKCVRNGLEATCVDVPRKKRSSNRAKSNAAVTPLSNDSSPSPSSSPALSAVAQPPPAPTFVPPQLQYMNVNLGPGVVGMPNGGLSMPPQAQYPFSVPWPGPQMVSMTWEEITKHVASAQNGGLTLVPPELAWKSTGEGLVQPGVMAPGEQPK